MHDSDSPKRDSPPTDFQQKITSQDLVLIRFIIKFAHKYDRFEIFLRAQEQEQCLAESNVLDLYLRYHRYLYPLITGKVSDETVGIQKLEKIEAPDYRRIYESFMESYGASQ